MLRPASSAVRSGLASIVAEILLRRQISANHLPIALPDRWFRPGLLPDVLAYEGFTGPQIARRISERLK